MSGPLLLEAVCWGWRPRGCAKGSFGNQQQGEKPDAGQRRKPEQEAMPGGPCCSGGSGRPLDSPICFQELVFALLQGIFPIQGLNPGLLNCRWIPEPPGKPKNTGVDSLFLLQGLSPTQKSKQGLLHCRWILYCLNHQGSPRILELVAYPFRRGSLHPGDRTVVSCIAGDSLPSELLGKPPNYL